MFWQNCQQIRDQWQQPAIAITNLQLSQYGGNLLFPSLTCSSVNISHHHPLMIIRPREKSKWKGLKQDERDSGKGGKPSFGWDNSVLDLDPLSKEQPTSSTSLTTRDFFPQIKYHLLHTYL